MLEVYQEATRAAQDQTASAAELFDAAVALDSALRTPFEGPGLPPDATALLLHLYDRAGSGDIIAAWSRISDMYSGIRTYPGLAPQPDRALAFARRAALTGDKDATIAYIRAVHFAPAELVVGVYSEAARLLNALIATDPEPQLLVLAAWMMADGEGYVADTARARELLEAAAAGDDPDAHFELYVYNRNGVGAEADASAAWHHLRAAADAGHPRAMANLGGMYATGRGVQRNAVLALEWYQRAADAGDARAARNLAVMYATGSGAPIDASLAEHYAALGAART